MDTAVSNFWCVFPKMGNIRILSLSLKLHAVTRLAKKTLNVKGIHGTWNLYSHGVVANDFLFISGQVALDEKGEIVGRNDIELQTEQVMQNLEKILKAANATFSDIVKIRVNLLNLNDRENLPASTLVEVNSLIDKDLLVEVEAIACLK
jgi:enamine deaminase RidA (YjgF/YER057c/UK114 family)